MTSLAILLLVSLMTKHFIADFAVQTPRMVKEKGIYGAPWGIYHSGIHAIMTFILFSLITGDIALSAIVSTIDGATHYHIDWSKQQVSKNYTYTDTLWWVYMGADQLFHYLIYIGIVWYVTTS